MRTSLYSLALALLCASTSAQTLFVDAQATTGLNDGSSWADAFQGQDALQAALSVATSGDQIFVAEGTYKPTSGSNRLISFVLIDGVNLFGGFAGTESSLGERPPFGAAPSILSGDLAGNDSSGLYEDNTNHVVQGGGAGPSTYFDGFLVEGGNASGPEVIYGMHGGGMSLLTANPIVRNCEFRNNRASKNGGALHWGSEEAIVLKDCRFIDNWAGDGGGGASIFGHHSFFSIERCTFRGNQAHKGGGLNVQGVEGSVIDNCLFYDNTATGSKGDHFGAGGGGLNFTGTITGGHMTNCTVARNVSLVNPLAGITAYADIFTVTNCIVWRNIGPDGFAAGAIQMPPHVPVRHSIVQGGFPGAGNTAADPHFVDPSGGNFRLRMQSPGIDSGDNAAVPASSTVDLDGLSRVLDAPSVADTGLGSAPLVDRGCHEFFEFQATSFCSGDGSSAACPCGNPGAPGAGCANLATGQGAVLSTTGGPSLSAGFLSFDITSMPSVQPALLCAGVTQIMGGAGSTFGDGLRCVGGSTLRLGVEFSDAAGIASWSSSVLAPAGILPGETRYFQAWYREPGGLCGTGFNLSQGLSITFQP